MAVAGSGAVGTGVVLCCNLDGFSQTRLRFGVSIDVGTLSIVIEFGTQQPPYPFTTNIDTMMKKSQPQERQEK